MEKESKTTKKEQEQEQLPTIDFKGPFTLTVSSEDVKEGKEIFKELYEKLYENYEEYSEMRSELKSKIEKAKKNGQKYIS